MSRGRFSFRRGVRRFVLSLGLAALVSGLSGVCAVFADDGFIGDGGKPANSILDFLKRRDPNYSAIIDGYFMYDARKLPDAVQVSQMTLDTSNAHGVSQLGALNALLDSAQLAGTRQGYFAALQAGNGGLDVSTKLALLSVLGDTLGGCYDNDAAANGAYTSQDAVWSALKMGSGKCGVCRDIHTFVADAARALGFVDAGTHTGIWEYGAEPGRHEITQLRDPKTGEYYVVNYSSVINTHEHTLTAAIDVSQRVLGPISGVSFIQSTPNDVHVYQPRTSRWIKQVLEQSTEFKPGQALISFNLGNAQRDVALNLSQNWGVVGVKTFATINQYDTAEGQFTVEAVGAVVQVKKDWELGKDTEIGVEGNAAGGYLGFNAPTVAGSPSEGTGTYERDNFFYTIKARLHARWNKFTAALEYEQSTIDFKNMGDVSAPYFAGTASVTYQPVKWASVSYARKFETSHDDNTHENTTFTTSYDKVSVIIDARIGKVFIYNKGELYLFEGAEKMSAVGIRDFFKARLPAGVLGQFSVYCDISKVVANPSADPFYQSDLHAIFGLEWSRPIIKQYLEIGGKIEYDATGKLPYYAFEDRGQVTPEMARTAGVRGMVWLHGSF